jgi:hypothetical protein
MAAMVPFAQPALSAAEGFRVTQSPRDSPPPRLLTPSERAASTARKRADRELVSRPVALSRAHSESALSHSIHPTPPPPNGATRTPASVRHRHCRRA